MDNYQQQKLDTLKKVSELLPANKELEPELIQLLRDQLKAFIEASEWISSNGTRARTELDLSNAIGEMFSEIPKDVFQDFPLTVGDITLSNFINDTTHYHKKREGFNTKSKSIRLIAAFLVCEALSTLQLDDLVLKDLHNIAASYLSQFIDNSPEKGDLTLGELVGYFSSKRSTGKDVIATNLAIDMSRDGSHLFIEERRSIASKSSPFQRKNTRCYYGWGVLTQGNAVLFFLKETKSEFTHIFVSTTVSLEGGIRYTADKITFLRFKSPLPYLSDGPEYPSSVLEQNLYHFVKTDLPLTVNKPIHDKNAKRELRKLRLNRTRFSPGRPIIKTRGIIMDDEKKQLLSKELFAILSRDMDYDFDRVFELLDMGASINYQDPKTEATVIHLAASWDLRTVREILQRSQEEYDYLTRSRKKYLASSWASQNMESGVYDFLRKKEIEAGLKIGVWPDVLRNRELSQEEIDSARPPPADNPLTWEP